jgi:hypothetical protein
MVKIGYQLQSLNVEHWSPKKEAGDHITIHGYASINLDNDHFFFEMHLVVSVPDEMGITPGWAIVKMLECDAKHRIDKDYAFFDYFFARKMITIGAEQWTSVKYPAERWKPNDFISHDKKFTWDRVELMFDFHGHVMHDFDMDEEGFIDKYPISMVDKSSDDFEVGKKGIGSIIDHESQFMNPSRIKPIIEDFLRALLDHPAMKGRAFTISRGDVTEKVDII